MATISKTILGNFCKVGIPKVEPFCIKSMPPETILPVVESRSTQLSKNSETGYGAISNPTYASTSVKQHLESSGSSTPSGREPNPKTS